MKQSDVLAGQTVLIVEDHYLIAEEMRRILHNLGAIIIGPASDMAAAQQCLLSRTVDLAVLDVNLDGIDVYALARQLKGQGVPIIFATGYGPESLPEDLADAGYIQKPVSQRAMVACLQRIGWTANRSPA